MTTAWASNADVRIAFEDSGGDGPAVLFSHGFLMNRSMFDAQLPATTDAYRCIRWDERGFGETRATGPFTYWDSADDAMAVLDACRVDRAVLVGMSQGGFLSMRAALRYPDRVAGIVLIDSCADLDDAATLDGYRAQAHVLEHGSDEDREGLYAVVASMILGDESLSAEWIGLWRTLDTSQLLLANDTLLGREDLSGRLGEIRCPVLSIHGTEDAAITLERGQATNEGMPDGRGLVPVAGAAHAPNMTHPDVVNVALRSFLDEVCGLARGDTGAA